MSVCAATVVIHDSPKCKFSIIAICAVENWLCRTLTFASDNLLTYLLTPWCRVLLEKLAGIAASQEIPRILWNPKNIAPNYSV